MLGKSPPLTIFLFSIIIRIVFRQQLNLRSRDMSFTFFVQFYLLSIRASHTAILTLKEKTKYVKLVQLCIFKYGNCLKQISLSRFHKKTRLIPFFLA